MIRILEVLATLKRAGAETMASSLARNLDASRFTPAVVTLYDASPGDLSAELEPIPVYRLGKRPGFDPRIYARLRRAIAEFEPDLIHTHSYVMRYTLPVWRGPAVHTVHNLAAREVDRLGRIVHTFGWRRGIVPVAVGRAVAAAFEATYSRPPSAVIQNGIDLRRHILPPETRAAWRCAHGFSEDDLLIVSAARLDPQKNPHLLAEAFTRAAIPGAHLLLAGDGSLRSALEGRPRIHVLGVRADLPQLLAAADLFVLASDWEGYPLALLEALASGLPVVATAVGGVSEIVEDGVSGVLTEPRNLETLSAAIRALANDSERRRTIAEAAKKRAVRFSVNTMVDSYSTLFESQVRNR